MSLESALQEEFKEGTLFVIGHTMRLRNKKMAVRIYLRIKKMAVRINFRINKSTVRAAATLLAVRINLRIQK